VDDDLEVARAKIDVNNVEPLVDVA